MISFHGFKKEATNVANVANADRDLLENLNENVIEKASSHQKEESESKEDIQLLQRERAIQDNIVENAGYKLYRDKSETFSCEVEIFGANIDGSKSRLVIETDNLTYLFEGSIDNQGKCKIPLKKMNFLNEYDSGKIKLEIIAEDTLFVPWESNFVAVNSKKVQVKIQNSDNQDPRIGISVKNISNG